MENTNVEQITESAQPADLLSYISGQQFEASNDESLVEQIQSADPVGDAPLGTGENVDDAASPEQQPLGVTPQQQTAPSDEAARLQQQVANLQVQQQRQLAAFALLADQARKREDALFDKGLSLMTDEEQTQARADRERQRIESENLYLRTQVQTHQQHQFAAAEQVDKANVAHTLLQRLGLPQDDQFVMAALMDCQHPAEMIATANRLRSVGQHVQQSAARTTAAQAAQTGVHKAGGETAPAAPPKKVAQRSGELIDMMRERAYALE